MRLVLAALALAALALAGCAHALPTVRWAKPGAGYDAFTADRAACVDYTRAGQQPFYLAGAHFGGRQDALDSGLFFSCMAARGWRKDPRGFAPPPGDRFALSP